MYVCNCYVRLKNAYRLIYNLIFGRFYGTVPNCMALANESLVSQLSGFLLQFIYQFIILRQFTQFDALC